HFTIHNINIIDGEVHYIDPSIPINYFVQKINIESQGKPWDMDTIAVQFSFESGVRNGSMKGNFTLNFQTLEYKYAVSIKKFDLNIIDQYLKDLTNYGHFSASLDADIKSKGNFRDPENVNITGVLQIDNFHFGKDSIHDYAS